MDRCKRLNTAKAERGFTLIEVMIVVAVLAIIAAIAIPQYQGYVTRAKRAEAKRTLLEAAQFLERNYTAAGCYSYSSTAGCLSQSGTVLTLPPPLLRAPNEGKASYEIPAPVFTNSGQVFSLVAIPCGSGGTCDAGSDPFVDATCDRFTLTNTGLRGLSGTYTGTLASCWQR